jgi:hypothetical protein
MRLRAPRHSLRHVSSAYYTPQSRRIELSAQYEPSRHDAQMLNVRTVPADPYMAWLDQREADRRSSTTAEPMSRRFTATESRHRITA